MFILSAFLAGCSLSIDISSAVILPASETDQSNIEILASGENFKNWKKVKLFIHSDDIIEAVRAESTIFVRISDCNSPKSAFPSIAFLENVALDEDHTAAAENLTKSGKLVEIHGYAPMKLLRGLKDACINLEGGSYKGFSIKSNHLRISLNPSS